MMLAYFVNNRHHFDFNQCRSQNIMKKNIQNPMSRVKFPAEYFSGVENVRLFVGSEEKQLKFVFM